MSRFWQTAGVACFWLSWPLLCLYLRIGKRTRILVIAEHEILVVKPWLSNGKWLLPGGGTHWREKSKDAAIRELFEETGIEVQSRQLIKLSDHTFNQIGIRFKYTLFALKLARKPAVSRRGLEILQLAWISPEHIATNNANQDVLTALTHLPD